MYRNYLFPHRFKKFGWMVFIPSLCIGLFVVVTDYEPSYLDFKVPTLYMDDLFGKGARLGMIKDNVLNEILGILFIISALVVAFSKARVEDEYISHLRESSLVWSVYANYIILLFALMFLHEFSFYWVMLFNMFTVLVLFILRFHWHIYSFSKRTQNDQ